MLRFHNTLTGTTDDFSTLEPGIVKMYNCGPTVYGTQHIGNLSMFVFTDVLRRTLMEHGYEVKQVINFTDFGHLTSDADEGEDKMSKGLKAEGLEPTLENMHKLGEKYAKIFLDDIKKLNVETEGIKFPYASQYVPQQLELVETLMQKGYGYVGSEGVYFDTSKFPDYGKLGHIDLAGLKEGARIGVVSEKQHPTDFLLWKYSNLGWDSPGGRGFPGWHIECSAMILALLGEQIDIHTGGIEHIAVHHNNEIAQSEAATGKHPFSRFWMHRAHLQIDGRKIAKSEGNVVYLSEIIERGYSPLALRYLLLGSHYRSPQNFTWEALDAAQNGYDRLRSFMWFLREQAGPQLEFGTIHPQFKLEFMQVMENDLNTSEALAVMWKMIKSVGEEISFSDTYATLLDFDKILGLHLEPEDATAEERFWLAERLTERQKAREAKDWARADAIRKEIENKGFKLKDTLSGPHIEKL